MAPRVFPDSVRLMQASPAMRVRHEMWHFVRAAWNDTTFVEQGGRAFLDQLGWGLPDDRAPFDAAGRLLLDNAAGEDFLFMHRNMIDMTNAALAAAGEAPITRWSEVPGPGDPETPVPPAWVSTDPSRTAAENQQLTDFLQFVKSDQYFDSTMRLRARFFEHRGNLGRLSLGALGNMVEMTIHNAMHMRWSTEPTPYRTQSIFGVLIGQAPYDPTWEGLNYDYLGDTFSSHVNPHFWYLHGWVDGLIDRWADANGMAVQDIPWTGTWLGGPDLLAAIGIPTPAPMPMPMPMPTPPAALTAEAARDALTALAGLSDISTSRFRLVDQILKQNGF